MPLFRLLAPATALLAFLALPARAAESYDNCTGFIDSLPATITTQGVWCLRHDLNTAMSTGPAISINTNNVTIDCNDFKLGGLSGGLATTAVGINAVNRFNATVRHCNIRGFLYGIYLSASAPTSSGGHVIEDNRLDSNTVDGIFVEGDGSVVRRNLISDTGGSTVSTGFAYGIYTGYSVDVFDNTVNGVAPTANGSGDGDAVGIFTSYNTQGSVVGNRVRSLAPVGASGEAQGIYNTNSGRISIERNHLVYNSGTNSVGVRCFLNLGNSRDNIISGFQTPVQTCTSSGNVIGF